MDQIRHAIREVLERGTEKEAVAYLEAFGLGREEQICLIEREIKNKSIQQIALALSLSPETVKRRRRSGLQKISDGIADTF